MRPNNFFTRLGRIPTAIISLLAYTLFLISLLFIFDVASAHGAPQIAADPSGQRMPGPGVNEAAAPTTQLHAAPAQVAPDQDATISSLTLTAGGSNVALNPSFDPETTSYTATVDAASVEVQASATRLAAGFIATVTGDTALTVTPVTNTLTVDIPLAEGRITDFSFTVRAEDEAATKTYHVAFSRPAADTVPDVTIEANRSEYVAGLEALVFTFTRGGDTTEDLEVTVNLVQTQAWLNFTSFTAIFHAGGSQTTYSLGESVFSSAVTQSGHITATVAPFAGYDMSEARTRVRVIYLEGPAVSVSLEHPAYTFGEDAGAVDVVLVARAAPGIPHVTDFLVSFLTAAGSATSGLADSAGTDYLPVSRMVQFDASDFRDEGGSLVARADEFVTIIDDDVHEGDELFHLRVERSPGMPREVLVLDSQGLECSPACANPYVVTITDNDPEPGLRLIVGVTSPSESAETVIGIELTTVDHTRFSEDQPITVNFRGSATFGEDYAIYPEDVTSGAPPIQTILSAEDGYAAIYLKTFNDSVPDACEWVQVSATIGANHKTTLYSPIITIIDDDNVAGVTTTLPVGLPGQRTGEIVTADNGRDWYSFDATGDEHYIIEVKHPLAFDLDSRTYQQVPGYLVDPSILEVVNDGDTRVLDEQDQGGYTLNFARAFFTPADSGTYRIAVGAGAQDRSGHGCYTISVRADDHADDYKTDPNVVLRPGESITATIDSDVSPADPNREIWIWGGRGIESVDDRDVFRYQIAEAGTYRVSVSDQPTGAGIWYVWNSQGNLFARATTAPGASAVLHHEPGTYYVEVGTPYESSGNTGTYTVAVEAVTDEGNGGRSTGEASTSAGIALAP